MHHRWHAGVGVRRPELGTFTLPVTLMMGAACLIPTLIWDQSLLFLVRYTPIDTALSPPLEAEYWRKYLDVPMPGPCLTPILHQMHVRCISDSPRRKYTLSKELASYQKHLKLITN